MKDKNEKNDHPDCSEDDDDPYRDVGRRLFAAVVSAQLNLKSIDYALKHYTPERPHRRWGQLGFQLQRDMQASIVEKILGPHPHTDPQRGLHAVEDEKP